MFSVEKVKTNCLFVVKRNNSVLPYLAEPIGRKSIRKTLEKLKAHMTLRSTAINTTKKGFLEYVDSHGKKGDIVDMAFKMGIRTYYAFLDDLISI